MIVLPNARRLVSPPAEEPISLQTAKDHCIVRHSLDDTLFNIWRAGARFHAEKLSGERMITQQWELTYPSFPPWREIFKVPMRPAQTLDSIIYTDSSGADVVFGTFSGSPLAPEEYMLVRDIEQPYVALKTDKDWPTPDTVAKIANAVRVTVTVGYNDDEASFATNPQTQLLRSGMLLLIGHFNENRENVIVSEQNPNAIEIPNGIKDLLYNPKVG
jgi:uncharacterized phiE125 gp8 family phage protein